MLYLTCTQITSVDLAHYGVSRAKNWVSVDLGTKLFVHCLEDCKTLNSYSIKIFIPSHNKVVEGI